MRVPDVSEVTETSEPEERSLQQLQITARTEGLPPRQLCVVHHPRWEKCLD